MTMSDSGIGNSSGRQRRSTERSRENIREYVKLLGKKVPDTSPGQKWPRPAREVRSTMDSSLSKLGSDEEHCENESLMISPPERTDALMKEKTMEKGCVSQGKSKEKSKSETEEALPTLHQDLGVKNMSNEPEKQSLDLKEKMDASQKVQNSPDETSSGKDDKGKTPENFPVPKDDRAVESCSSKNADISQDFCGFNHEVQTQPKIKDTKPDTPVPNVSKKCTPKSEKAESSRDSPPDLVPFLKEGRGRAQIWNEPPTLDPENIAARRKTRTPEHPKSLSKEKSLLHQFRKESKEDLMKDKKKEKKLKVLEKPPILKRLAPDYPIKDSSKSSSTSIQESRDEKKSAKKIIPKNELEYDKVKTAHTPVSTDDRMKSNINRAKGKKKTANDMSSAAVIDVSKGNLEVLPCLEGMQGKHTDYSNLETILHQMSENKADTRIPVVIMSDSDKDNVIIKAMPKSKKRTQSKEKASKAVLKMATPKKLTVGNMRLPEEHSPTDNKYSLFKGERKSHKYSTEQNLVENVDEDSCNKTLISCHSQSTKEDSNSTANTRPLGPLESCERKLDDNTSTDSDSLAVSQDSGKVSESEGISSPLLMPVSIKSSGAQNSQKPLWVNVADLLSLKVTSVNSVSSISPRKLNLKIPKVKGLATDLVLKNGAGFAKDTFIIKGGVMNTSPKTMLLSDEGSQTSSNQQSNLNPHKVHLYTDIETEEVVVGETEDNGGQALKVGDLSSEVNLYANEELESSSEDDNNKTPEAYPSIKKDMLSPEGRVALDHSYSSGSSEKSKGPNSARKKSPASYEKTITPRPVYSSASLAKRSLDIMLHNDKINILRQMSQIFNHEKPAQPDTDNTVSSSEEGEEDVKETLRNTRITKQNTVAKETNALKDSSTDKNSLSSREGSSETATIIRLKTGSNPKPVCNYSTEIRGSSSLHTSKDADVSSLAVNSKVDSIKEDSAKDINASKTLTSKCVDVDKSGQTNVDNDRSVSKNGKDMNEAKVSATTQNDGAFLGFPDPEPKVHHVPAYSVALDELIHVQSTVGPSGESIDIVDGFSFISFTRKEEMIAYTNKQNNRGEKGHRPWLKKRRRKRKRLMRKKGLSALNQNQVSDLHRSSPQASKESNDSGAFASNDLDAYLDHNSHLNISYTIPKCKATEEGVTRIDADEMLEDNKPEEIPAQVPEPILMESQSVDGVDPNGQQAPSAETAPCSIQQYEEVSALDILYPKEKYKYYYNKDLCKETKADGSNVFVRRGGKLVPLTSVFKSQKPSAVETSSRKTVELVYIYDRGKLLTLGGSLTKINPSNSDSVRARVVLPIGIPPILKGDVVQSRAKKVQAVEINEDLAKFALSALQNPNSKEEKSTENNSENESKPVPEVGISQEKTEKPKCEEEEKPECVKKPEKVSVKPTKKNILDIIAAKLAMSDEESDEKEEEEDKPKAKGKEENDLQGDDEKCVDKDTKEDVVKEADKDKSPESEIDKTLTSPPEEKSDTKEEEGKQTKQESETAAGEKDDVKKEESSEAPVKEHAGSEDEDKKSDLKTEDKNVIGDNKNAIGVKDEAEEVKAVVKNDDVDSKEDDKAPVCSGSVNTEAKNQTKDSTEDVKESLDTKLEEDEDQKDDKKGKEALGNTSHNTGTDSLANYLDNENTESAQDEVEEQNADEKKPSALPEMTEGATDKNFEKIDSKIRVFKKNIYRFPSLSREMKRLNMNFVKYVPQEPTAEDTMAEEVEIKENCENEHCRLGCICDSLSCRRRSMEHCGRMECMFKCTCRDESWKHSVSGTGRTMNAVSIFNLDREQNEGLAVREKDFRRTVIQTSSEVILVGAERKKRERRIPGRYRDSAMWTGTDFVAVDSTSTSEADTPMLPEFPSIPLSEASKYIKQFKLAVPWYDIKGISIWCMDHSCYDCRCLVDPSFHDSPREAPAERNDDPSAKASDALDTLEEALREKRRSPGPAPAPTAPHAGEAEDAPPASREAFCSVVNIIVNNTEARRKYSWKLKEWYHPNEVHCARTSGYSKRRISEETKHMTISGLAARATTPEQMVESVVKSLRKEKEKAHLRVPGGGRPDVPGGGKPDVPDGGKPEAPVPDAPTSDSGDVSVGTSEAAGGTVPLVDLTSSSYADDVDVRSPSSSAKATRPATSKNSKKTYLLSRDVKGSTKRKLSGLVDVPGHSAGPSTKRTRKSIVQEDGPPPSASSSLESRGPEGKKSSIATLYMMNNEKESKGANSEKKPHRKPISLVEMMLAEENRGELELDLSNNFPGNALLVAEARFRKLINMNIIGVIGINKAGRCIIDTVDSIESLRVMQRIHNMISNSTLDVGPNMREIFFPPPYIGTRPRFVMIRCDLNKKWEIVGVVQKKGPVKTSKYPELRAKASMIHKASSTVPQVIDLEEEEKLKEQPKEERPDVVILPEDDVRDPLDNDSSEETGSGAWEGSLPLISSVHSVSDANMAEFMGSPERTSNDSEDKAPEFEVVSSVARKTTTKTIPDLVPISSCSVNEPDGEVSRKEVIKTGNSVPISGVRSENQQLYFAPVSFSSSSKTAVVNSISGRNTIKVSTISSRGHTDSLTELIKESDLQSSLRNQTGAFQRSSPQPIVSGFSTSGKLCRILPKVTPESSANEEVRPESSTSVKEEPDIGSVDDPHQEISQRKEVLKTPKTVVIGARSELPQEHNNEPAAFSTLTKTTTTLSAVVTATPGMKTFRLNPSSGQVMGDTAVESSLPIMTTAFSPRSTSEAGVSESDTAGKLIITTPKVTSDSPASVKEELSSNAPKVNEGPIQNRRVLSPAIPGSTALNASAQSVPEEGTSNAIVGQNSAASSTPNSKMLYIPVSSGCLNKMLFVPTVSGGTSQRMMLLPIQGNSGDNSKMKMVLVPSTQDNSKMILFPTATEASDAQSTNTVVTSASSENEKKMLVLPPTVLGNLSNFITKPPHTEQKSKFILPRPAVVGDSQSFASSCTGTLLVPLKSAGTTPTKSAQPDEAPPVGKTETPANAIQENEKDAAVQDDSDDVVVIGPATNSLTITRVRTASESTFSRAELSSSKSCTSPSLLIMPAPPVSSGGKAETNVVSSVITITSTLSGKMQQAQGDCNALLSASDVSPKASVLNSTSSPEDAVIVKTSLNAMQLNALLQSTHKEMLKGDSWPGGTNIALDSKALQQEGEGNAPENRLLRSSCESPSESPAVEQEQKCAEEVEEVGSKRVPIKKGGYHWSAVDLSLNFKSVKLEWLLGTIRKNVLMNIYRMSLKTNSPVTLSVKNGSSTSMLYGLARKGYVCKGGEYRLPILILGSVISAVRCSLTTPDATLFQVNAIKYFIRENTGELSSYTYDTSGDFLVKLASKKRGDGGEMIGIGEKVPIEKMREASFITENSSCHKQSGKTGSESIDDKSCSPKLKSKAQDCNGCSCTLAGDFICLGHSTPQLKDKEKISSASQSATCKSQSLPVEHSDVIHDDSVLITSTNLETQSLKEVSGNKESKIQLSSVSGSAITDISQSTMQLKESIQDSLNLEREIDGTSSQVSKDAQHSKEDCNTKNKDRKSVTPSELESTDKVTPVTFKFVCNSKGKNSGGSESNLNPKVDKVVKHKKTISTPNVKVSEGKAVEDEVEDTASESSEGAQGSNNQDENEDVDIVGDCDTNLSISTWLREQITDDTVLAKRANQPSTPGDVAKRLLALPTTESSHKRKMSETYPRFERPCPRSKKRLLNNMGGRKPPRYSSGESPSMHDSAKSDRSSSSGSPSRCPSHLAHLRHSSYGELSIVSDEEAKPGPSGVQIPKKPKFNVIPGGKRKLGNKIVRIQRKEVKFVDVEVTHEERNSVVHNELERMRRRVMRHLFTNLQNCISKVPSKPPLAENVALPKITILSAAERICEILKLEEAKLWTEKERIMRERSSLIKKLASVIADKPEHFKHRWRQWVHDHMKNPTAKQSFEKNWKPIELEKEVMTFSSGESSFDMDLDDGSPLPGPASPLSLTDRPAPPLSISKEVQTSKQKLVKSKGLKGKKKIGRPHKLILDSKYQGMNITTEAATVIPTSILLMAGTSSRGRKIVRKEDTNFVSS